MKFLLFISVFISSQLWAIDVEPTHISSLDMILNIHGDKHIEAREKMINELKKDIYSADLILELIVLVKSEILQEGTRLARDIDLKDLEKVLVLKKGQVDSFKTQKVAKIMRGENENIN